jgi:hypothetical protein
MLVECPTCGLTATVTPTARDTYTTRYNEAFVGCPVFGERLQRAGTLKGADICCPEIDDAAARAFHKFLTDNQL